MSMYEVNLANKQIIEAFGLEISRVRSFQLELDKDCGPIATVELYQVNSEGKKYQGDDGALATVIERFVFVKEETT